MQSVIIYTAQHTGTWFLIHTLYNNNCNKTILLTDAGITERGRDFPNNFDNFVFSKEGDNFYSPAECFPIKKLDQEWINKYWLNYTNEEEKDADLALLHFHCRDPYTDFIPSIKTEGTDIPIITSIRDPLLSVLSLCSRNRTVKEFKTDSSYSRVGRAHIQAERFRFILSTDNNLIFKVPIDIEYNREEKINNMLKHCNIIPNDRMKEYITNWNPVNNLKYDGLQEYFNIRQAIIYKDKNFLEKHFKVEYDYFQRCEDLKEMLSKLGYTNLVWW